MHEQPIVPWASTQHRFFCRGYARGTLAGTGGAGGGRDRRCLPGQAGQASSIPPSCFLRYLHVSAAPAASKGKHHPHPPSCRGSCPHRSSPQRIRTSLHRASRLKTYNDSQDGQEAAPTVLVMQDTITQRTSSDTTAWLNQGTRLLAAPPRVIGTSLCTRSKQGLAWWC